MTVTPQPPNGAQEQNQPSQNGRVIRLTTTNIILGVLVIIGLTMSVVAIYFSARNPPTPTNMSEQESKMNDLGMQWAQGYAEALQLSNPDQNVLNSLYGACVLYTDRRIVPQYGSQLAPSWLRGCLAYTQQQQNTATTTNT